MTSELAPTDQLRLVFEGIQSVAARCDGARSLDLKGFDGQDTHYGRRISAVPFERLSEDDHAEISRIALKYRQQILTYTGNDMSTLSVVRDAQGKSTNHASRENARRFEREGRDAEQREVVKNQRRVELLINGQVGVSWVSKKGRSIGDPDFNSLVAEVRQLPGRFFNAQTSTNWVDPSEALLTFCDQWGMEVPADVIAAVEARAAVKVYNIGVLKGGGGKRLWIKADYDAARVTDARELPGRRWNGTMDEVDAHPAVLAFAEKWNLEISPKAQAAINDAGEEAADAAAPENARLNRAGLLSVASRAGNVNDLPAEFVNLVKRAVGA